MNTLLFQGIVKTALLTVLITGCAPGKVPISTLGFNTTLSSHIIGGKFVPEHSSIAASTVGIYDHKNNFTCTATLLTETIAITAAHCIESNTAADIQVIFALELSATLATNKSTVNNSLIKSATAVKVHPLWTGDFNRSKDWCDLALVQFSGSLPNGYKPATWLPDKADLTAGTKVIVAGYGATEAKITQIYEKKFPNLEKAIASEEIVCDENFENEKRHCYRVEFLGDDDLKMTDVLIESQSLSEIRLDESHGHGTCVGDSGGPAFIEKKGIYYYFGITSRGSNACDGYGIYTNAVHFKSWIDENIKLLSSAVKK